MDTNKKYKMVVTNEEWSKIHHCPLPIAHCPLPIPHSPLHFLKLPCLGCAFYQLNKNIIQRWQYFIK